MQAIRIIQDEHRSLAAVLHGMLYLVRQTRDRGTKPDFVVLGAIVLWLADRLGSRRREIDGLDAPSALAIGLSQRATAPAGRATAAIPASPSITSVRARSARATT